MGGRYVEEEMQLLVWVDCWFIFFGRNDHDFMCRLLLLFLLCVCVLFNRILMKYPYLSDGNVYFIVEL